MKGYQAQPYSQTNRLTNNLLLNGASWGDLGIRTGCLIDASQVRFVGQSLLGGVQAEPHDMLKRSLSCPGNILQCFADFQSLAFVSVPSLCPLRYFQSSLFLCSCISSFLFPHYPLCVYMVYVVFCSSSSVYLPLHFLCILSAILPSVFPRFRFFQFYISGFVFEVSYLAFPVQVFLSLSQLPVAFCFAVFCAADNKDLL